MNDLKLKATAAAGFDTFCVIYDYRGRLVEVIYYRGKGSNIGMLDILMDTWRKDDNIELTTDQNIS